MANQGANLNLGLVKHPEIRNPLPWVLGWLWEGFESVLEVLGWFWGVCESVGGVFEGFCVFLSGVVTNPGLGLQATGCVRQQVGSSE